MKVSDDVERFYFLNSHGEEAFVRLADYENAWKQWVRCQHWDEPPSGTAIELLDKMAEALSSLTSKMSSDKCGEVWRWFWQLDERLRKDYFEALRDKEKIGD